MTHAAKVESLRNQCGITHEELKNAVYAQLLDNRILNPYYWQIIAIMKVRELVGADLLSAKKWVEKYIE